MRIRHGITAGTLVFFASIAVAGPADWPHWRGPNHDGKSADQGLLREWPESGPALVWKVDGIGKGFSSVAVSDDLVFITGDTKNELVALAFDLEGEPQWNKRVDKAYEGSPEGSRASPTVAGENVYILSGHGTVACLDARTGAPQWSRKASEFGGRPGGWGYAESVLITGNLAIFKPGGERCIVALDRSTGETVWESSGFTAGPEYGSCLPVDFEQTPLIVTGTTEGLVCVDARTGKKLWLNPWSRHNTANCPTPVSADGHIFWANGYGQGGICLRLSRSEGEIVAEEVWTTRNMDCHHGGYVIHGGHVYGNHANGWACLDLKTGEMKWRERGVGKGSLCWADGMLILFGENGGKVGLGTCSPDRLEMRGTFNVEGSGPSWAHPVVAGGRLYVRYDDHLYCFDVKGEGGGQ
ncbi:MAG: PQQ-binding-like beta-propeller repeat protein [Planctomycetota bacterium]